MRIARDADDAAVQRLLRDLNPQAANVPWNWNAVRQGARSFVVELDRRVVGFAMASFIDHGPSNYGVIEELVIDEAFRGRGIGPKLLAACCDWLKEQKLQVIFASTSAERVAFYQRQGFRQCTGPWMCRGLQAGASAPSAEKS